MNSSEWKVIKQAERERKEKETYYTHFTHHAIPRCMKKQKGPTPCTGANTVLSSQREHLFSTWTNLYIASVK